MSLFKIIVSFTIFLSSSVLGILYGNVFNKRERSLRDLEYNIRLLQSEIVAGNSPLPFALENTYKKGKGDIKLLFLNIQMDLRDKGFEDVYKSFLSQEELLQKKYMLKKEDISIFLFLGKILGKTNVEDQDKNLSFIITQIEKIKDEASIEKNNNVKLYRTLGVLMGLGIIIIMI